MYKDNARYTYFYFLVRFTHRQRLRILIKLPSSAYEELAPLDAKA